MRTKKAQLESSARKWRGSPHLWDLRTACIRNAIDLLKDARILYKHRRYSRAFALAYTAHEEFGKAQIVSDFITGICSADEFWGAFRRHDLKSAYNLRKLSIDLKTASPPTVEYDTQRAKTLFKLRLDSFYVDCSDDYTPSTPKGRIGSRTAKEAIEGVNKHMARVLWLEKFTERIGTEALAK